ncbi:MAG: LysE family transporter [Clostridiales bacterium]|nr:LysE family transporter [Clostridiales bacterium]
MRYITGIIIGIFVTLPVGPLGLMAIQRTIKKDWKTGCLAGIGAALSDMFYSSIAVLGASFIDEFINKNKYFISGTTGIIFLIVGINILMSGIEKSKLKELPKEEGMHPFFIHFLLGLSNPMTFIVFITVFAAMGVSIDNTELFKNVIFVISIFIGSCILWLVTSNIVEKTKSRLKFESFIFIDKLIGAVIVIFGICGIFKGIAGL